MGVLYGRYDLLDSLTAYKVRPAPQEPPGKFETGTGNFEGMCGEALEDSGGMVRVGPVHYNTLEEIKRFGEVMGRIAAVVT